jgi:hypothetical protein
MADPVLAAQQLLAEYDKTYGLGEIPPIPVEDIAESLLLLDVVEEDEVRSVPGAPVEDGPLSGLLTTADHTIWIDRREAARSPARRRFTIAHEVGHWVLHAGRGGDPGFQRGCAPADLEEETAAADREWEANDFANELLMPAELISRLATECGFNLALLAERFQVSVPALELRLMRLSLLPAWMRA